MNELMTSLHPWTQFNIEGVSEHIYTVPDLDNILGQVHINWIRKRSKQKTHYADLIMSFDIETSSFYSNDEKRAIMYVWQISINGYIFMGRTWEEFIELVNKVTTYFKTDTNNRIIIWVHNLAWEFQFIRYYFDWFNVFAADIRKPIYAVTTSGIEFRCSYFLSAYSLDNLAKNLVSHNIKKLKGDLDYDKIHHSKTPLTADEINYCINDVKIVDAYIQEQIEEYGDITSLPLTNTGRVRQFCRSYCFDTTNKYQRSKFNRIIKQLTLTLEEYQMLKDAFQGGFTHANNWYISFEYDGKYYDKSVKDVISMDFTSDYPYQMVANLYPMGKPEWFPPEKMTTELFNKSIRHYACCFEISIKNVEATFKYEHYISSSRCKALINPVLDNGRVVSADHIVMTITEQDYFIINKTYTYTDLKIGKFFRMNLGPLPTEFVKAIIQLYKDKTQLKGVSGEEINYMRSKGMLNSCYGMAVTDILRGVIEYKNDWPESSTITDPQAIIDDYNNNYNRFLYYAWGIWVTAYARRSLWSGILECGEDYIYADTDSVKIKNYDKHKQYFDNYNKNVINKLKRAAEWHNLKLEDFQPKTIKGVKKPLGVWDYDGHYKIFKTLGAKRYMCLDDYDNIHLTVAGLSKSLGAKYLSTKYKTNKERFRAFNDDMVIPEDYSGRLTHTYIDEEHSGYVTDYLGNKALYRERSGIHLEKSEYNLSLAQEYIEYIIGLNDLD